MQFDVEEINRLIQNRRSIYPQFYSDEVISDDIVETILKNADMAPSHKLTQPWRFMVFSGEGRRALANFQASFYRDNTPHEDFSMETFNKLVEKPMQCSHVIAIGMKRNAKELVPEIEEIEAVACAVQNMYLTATAYGIGAYWGSGGVTYKEEAKAFFGLEKEDKLLGFFFMGYPTIEWPKPGRRTPLEEKVIWVKD